MKDRDGNVRKLPATGIPVETVCSSMQQCAGGNGSFPDEKPDLRRRDEGKTGLEGKENIKREEKKEKEEKVAAKNRMPRAVGFSKRVDNLDYPLFERQQPWNQHEFRYSPLELKSIRCAVRQDSPLREDVEDFIKRFQSDRKSTYCDQTSITKKGDGRCTKHELIGNSARVADRTFDIHSCGTQSTLTIKCLDLADVLTEIVEECAERKGDTERVEGHATYSYVQEYKRLPGVTLQHAFIQGTVKDGRSGAGPLTAVSSMQFLSLAVVVSLFLMVYV